MKVLLTGASGFLGSAVCKKLLKDDHKVILTKRSKTIFNRLKHIQADLEIWNIEDISFGNVFKVHADIDVVIHAATDYGRDSGIPTSVFWANEVFPMRLLEMAACSNVKNFINFDTFFNSDAQSYDYLGPYTLSKRGFQQWGRLAGLAGIIKFINMKLFHVYGIGDGKDKFVTSMVSSCLDGRAIKLTSGQQRRDFIYVDDVVDAVIKVLAFEINGDPGYMDIDVGTGSSTSIIDFMHMLKKISNSDSILNFGALESRSGEFADSIADTNKLNAIGWSPRIDLANGLERLVNYARNEDDKVL